MRLSKAGVCNSHADELTVTFVMRLGFLIEKSSSHLARIRLVRSPAKSRKRETWITSARALASAALARPFWVFSGPKECVSVSTAGTRREKPSKGNVFKASGPGLDMAGAPIGRAVDALLDG